MLPSNAPEWESAHPPSGRGKRPGRGGVIVGIVVLLIVVVAVIGLVIGRLGNNSQPTAAAPTRSTAATASQPTAVATQAGTPADQATQQAIQQVIQQVDHAQEQALTSNDPSVMQSTATSDFYNLQVQTNQDLVSNGVTEIKLVNIEWGPITINGNTATATVWETWSTTFDDGTSEQSRDRNVYTLVNDGGTWKVQADDHPDEQNATPQAPAPGQAP
ncbi:MAG: hypothetical protein JOZ81_02530 [Chloroflexi bacterium]|nr:hypothetical protein [Chloroflexota bacterium]MBV9543201.1 hypothetical protein [Chloroflexota bacterium]